MADDKLRVTRNQFAEFIKDHDTIKQFERLFDIANGNSIPSTYDLTSGNATATLPKVTGYPQSVDIFWTNGGTYTLTLAVTNSETVGGLAASIWTGEGEGSISVVSDGTNWEVRSYQDNGVNANGFWYKYKDGRLYCKARGLGLTVYASNEKKIVSWTLPSTMINTAYTGYAAVSPQTTTDWYGCIYVKYDTNTTTVCGFVIRNGGTAQNSVFSSYEATGRWRA